MLRRAQPGEGLRTSEKKTEALELVGFIVEPMGFRATVSGEGALSSF